MVARQCVVRSVAPAAGKARGCLAATPRPAAGDHRPERPRPCHPRRRRRPHAAPGPGPDGQPDLPGAGARLHHRLGTALRPRRASRLGLTIAGRHSARGRDASLFASVHHFGWCYYSPAVFFFKTPLPFLLLAGIGAAVIVMRRREALELVFIPAALMLSVLP